MAREHGGKCGPVCDETTVLDNAIGNLTVWRLAFAFWAFARSKGFLRRGMIAAWLCAARVAMRHLSVPEVGPPLRVGPPVVPALPKADAFAGLADPAGRRLGGQGP